MSSIRNFARNICHKIIQWRYILSWYWIFNSFRGCELLLNLFQNFKNYTKTHSTYVRQLPLYSLLHYKRSYSHSVANELDVSHCTTISCIFLIFVCLSSIKTTQEHHRIYKKTSDWNCLRSGINAHLTYLLRNTEEQGCWLRWTIQSCWYNMTKPQNQALC